MSHDSSELAPFVANIERAYDQLGHQLGWRFLYGPARTLSPDIRLAFVGLNPGGGRYRPPMASVETGNAYRVERWGGRSGPNPLQLQIGLLYQALASKLGASSAAKLMDDTLAVNFCPFRSPSWDTLASSAQSVAFSRELWGSLTKLVHPDVIVCLGELAARNLGAALEEHGFSARRGARKLSAGWGSVSYGLAQYAAIHRETLVVRLPHLSRFGIFGRPASASAVDHMTDAIAAALANGRRPE